MKNLKNKDKSLKEQNSENLVTEDKSNLSSVAAETDTNENGLDLSMAEEKNKVADKDDFSEQKGETKITADELAEKEKDGLLDTAFGIFISEKKQKEEILPDEKSEDTKNQTKTQDVFSLSEDKKNDSLFEPSDNADEKKKKKDGKKSGDLQKSDSKKENSFVIFSKKYWWTYFIVFAVVIAIVVTVTVLVLTKDYINIYEAEDFSDIDKGNIYVLKKDITVEGDLTIDVPYPINFNGHTLNVKGNLTVNAEKEGTIYYGSEKDGKEKSVKSKLIADSLTVNAVKSDILFRVTVECGTVNITAGSVTSDKNLSSLNITLSAINISLNGTAGQDGGSITILGSTECQVNNVLSDIKAVNTNLKVNQNAAVKNIVLEKSNLDIYGSAENISGGNTVHFRQGAYAFSVKEAQTLKSYDYSLPDYIDGNVQIVNVLTLSTPWNITFTQINGGLYCLFPSVSNATGYEITVDGKDPFVFPYETDNSTVAVNLTDYINTAGEHTVTVKAVSDKENFVSSQSVTASYVFTSKLSIPSDIKTYEENGRVLITFNKVSFADLYKITVTGTDGTENSFTVNATSDTVQSFDITNYIQSGAGLYGITVSSASNYPDYYSESDEAVLSFAKYEKIQAPSLVLTSSELNITASANSLAFEIYENGILTAVTKNSTYTLKSYESGTVITVKAIGHGYYTESDFAQITVP